MVGPFNIIGSIYWAKCVGPSIAVGMASEDDSGPIWHNWQRFDQRVRAHLTLSAGLLVAMVGPFNIIGNIHWAKCVGPSIAVGRASEDDSGPIRHNRQSFEQRVWAHLMLSADLLVTMVGPLNIIGNIHWAECVGPSIDIGRASEDDSGPIRHNRQRFDQLV